MKRTFTILALAATMELASASVALAGPNENAFCEGTAGATSNHGGHITGDYVHPANDGGGPADSAAGGAPAHFAVAASPGASFCQGTNSAPDLSADPPHGR